MTTPTSIRSVLALAFAVSMFPALAASQPLLRAAGPEATTTTTADELQERAAALHDQPGRYSEAARLYKESAALRAGADPRAIEALALAAHLYHYDNRLFDARKVMEQAAKRALARGDVVRASMANLEAALFAFKQGQIGLAERLGRNALELAASPLLTAEQRASIVNRLQLTPAIAELVE